MDWRASKPGHDAPMADEPRDLVDCWPFLVCGVVVVIALVCARSWGLLP
jgi:hypothetical protein